MTSVFFLFLLQCCPDPCKLQQLMGLVGDQASSGHRHSAIGTTVSALVLLLLWTLCWFVALGDALGALPEMIPVMNCRFLVLSLKTISWFYVEYRNRVLWVTICPTRTNQNRNWQLKVFKGALLTLYRAGSDLQNTDNCHLSWHLSHVMTHLSYVMTHLPWPLWCLPVRFGTSQCFSVLVRHFLPVFVNFWQYFLV